MKFLIILIIFLLLPLHNINAWYKELPEYPDCNLLEFYDDQIQWLKTQTLTKQNSPYCLTIQNTLPANETLTIEAGSVIKFVEPYYWGNQGVKLYIEGTLNINGTKDEPVIFTSIYDDSYLGDTNNDESATSPSPGDWDFINLENSQAANINYAVFKYGGKNMGKMIRVNDGSNISIQNSFITQSWGDGITVTKDFKNFKYNLIFNNQGNGLKNYGLNNVIDAKFNWWGSDQGPRLQGINEPDDLNAQKIKNHFGTDSTILFDPWLNSENEIVPLWRRNIEPGDILYDPYSWGVGHIGIYIGNNKVIEAQGTLDGIKLAGQVNENNITKWDYPNRKNVYLLRIKKPENKNDLEWQNIKNSAIEFAKNQTDLPYDWAWLDKSYDINSASWYCSELVWASYYNQGINLEHYGDPKGTISPVSPTEIYLDSDTHIISGHQEYTGGWKDYVFLLVLSPINVTITDPNGNIMTKNNINIPGAHYLEDVVGPDGHIYDQIILPNINDKYQISVSKKPEAGTAETYSLHIKNGNNSLLEVLAQDKIVPADDQTHNYNFNPGGSSIIDVGSFYDTENSNSNTWTAGTLDIDISSPSNFPAIEPSQNSERKFLIQNNGSLNAQYNIDLNNFSENNDFCNLLNLQTSDYMGLLTNFSFNASLINSNATSSLNFNVSLNNNHPQWQNQTCKFDFDLIAWQTNFSTSSLGFSDSEIASNTITSGSWFDPTPDHLIINEVFYDVDSPEHGAEYDNEWIEIYNPTDSSVNISNWQICDNNQCDTLPASDSIASNGFAIITADTTTQNFWEIPTSTILIILNERIGNGLANISDRIILKQDDGAEIDAMSYNNDTTAFDPACPDVSEGHSLSRITGPDTNMALDWEENNSPNPGE